MTNPNIQTLVSFAAAQMDGQQPPPSGPKLAELLDAIEEIFQHQSSAEFEIFGREVMRLCFNKIKSNHAAEKTLQKFITKQ